MRTNSHAPPRGARPAAVEPAPKPRPDYLAGAQLFDILVEQLEYLTVHASQTCPPECPDCVRLSQAANWLLLPFREASERSNRHS